MAKLRIRCKPEYIHLFGKEPETLAETERSLRSAEVIHGFLKKRDEEEKTKIDAAISTPYRRSKTFEGKSSRGNLSSHRLSADTTDTCVSDRIMELHSPTTTKKTETTTTKSVFQMW